MMTWSIVIILLIFLIFIYYIQQENPLETLTDVDHNIWAQQQLIEKYGGDIVLKNRLLDQKDQSHKLKHQAAANPRDPMLQDRINALKTIIYTQYSEIISPK
jgi:hypothetical protein